MSRLTKDQLKRVKEDFKRLDANGDGKLTVKEFRAAMQAFLAPQTLDELVAKINTDGNRNISWKEFLADYQRDLDAPTAD